MTEQTRVATSPVHDWRELEVGAVLTGGASGRSTAACPELGVTAITMVDGPAGLVSPNLDERDTSLLLPTGTALAATWSPSITREVGEVLGQQARERDVDVVLGPNLNLPRTPLTGRGFEMFSEDPYLTGVLGASWIEGIQSQGVGACAKHVVANDTETERRQMDARVSPAVLRETYLLPFEIAVARANPWMLMMAYNRVNGTYCSRHPGLIDILKSDWGYDGVVVSDWFGTDGTVSSARAGLDLEMPGPPRFFGQAFATAVQRGEVEAGRLADAVDRMVRLADRTGHRAGAAPAPVAPARTGNEPLEVLHAAAAASFVLLENKKQLLPIRGDTVRNVVVVGPNAVSPCFQGGTFGRVRPQGDVQSPLDALCQALGPDVQVSYAPGAPLEEPLPFTDFTCTAPDGQPGILLQVFDHDVARTEPLHADRRQTSSFVWFGEVPGLGANAAGRVRLSTTLIPEISGPWALGVGGTGATKLWVDGRERLTVPAPEAADVMGTVARAETESVMVDLLAGQETEIIVETVFEAGRVQAITAVALPPGPADPLGEAVAAAAEADLVIAVVGDQTTSSRESSDRTSASLDPAADALVHSVSQVNGRTAVVVNASRPVLLPWADNVGAVLMAWFPGQQFGPALASVLTGLQAPSGRLPVSLPNADFDVPSFGQKLDDELALDYDATEPTGYRGRQLRGAAARYPFGFGLGYTNFSLDAAEVLDQPHKAANGEISVALKVTVTNTGDRPGRDVIQLYGRAPGEKDFRLQGFGSVDLDGGATADLRLHADPLTFRRWDDAAGEWHVPVGEWDVRAARDCDDPGIIRKITL